MLVIKVISAKLHGIRITRTDLDYRGSVTLDPEHGNEADIRRFEFVDIWNKNSGARINTYVNFGEAGSRCCTLNGAAARGYQIADEVVIAASEYIDPVRLCEFDTMVLIFNGNKSIRDRLKYRVRRNTEPKISQHSNGGKVAPRRICHFTRRSSMVLSRHSCGFWIAQMPRKDKRGR
jgi:aspartate 1-decarboxylase